MSTPLAASAARVSDCDVLVICGGPADSTAATLLAERGYRVTLLGKNASSLFHFRRTLQARRMHKLNRG